MYFLSFTHGGGSAFDRADASFAVLSTLYWEEIERILKMPW